MFFTFTEVSVRTLKRIKKEGTLNGVNWNTPGKKTTTSINSVKLGQF
jgi:hypothetical protein